MDIYNSRYFVLNKRLQIVLGIWPYDTEKKYIIRVFCLLLTVTLYSPQVISMKLNFSNLERLFENIVYVMMGCMIFLKIFTLGLSQNKLRIMFEGIKNSWQLIVDEDEIRILHKYSERGRLLTIFYLARSLILVFCLTCFSTFTLGAMIPVILNKLSPNSEPHPYIYLLDGEFLLEDNDAHYFKIYFWDALATFMMVLAICATNTTYAACVEHCLGLYAIVSYRIRNYGQLVIDSPSHLTDSNYKLIIETAKLHQRILQLKKALEVSYSTCFFCVSGLMIIIIPFSCNLILMNLDDPVQVIRFAVPFCGNAFVLFNMCWPGQKLIDASECLFYKTYYNEWYESSVKSNKMLAILMVQCSRPSTLTAGGLMTVNFQTFFSIMKTAISYITVIASFR